MYKRTGQFFYEDKPPFPEKNIWTLLHLSLSRSKLD